MVLPRLQDGKQAKRQRVEVTAGEGRAYLPAPEGTAVGPAHLVRQHGQPPRTEEPSSGAVFAPGPQPARPATASWPRASDQMPRAGEKPREPQEAAGVGQSHNTDARRKQLLEPMAAIFAPRWTLADLAKQSRLAATRQSSGAAADRAGSAPAPPPQVDVRADAAGSRPFSAKGAPAEVVPAKRPPEEDTAVYIRRLKAELPPAAHAAVLSHLATYRCGRVRTMSSVSCMHGNPIMLACDLRSWLQIAYGY